jgi:hypothetical protein
LVTTIVIVFFSFAVVNDIFFFTVFVVVLDLLARFAGV